MKLSSELAAQAFKDRLNEMESMVRSTEKAVIHESGHAFLVTENINFFTKSFLIFTCAQLEMCIKEIVFSVASELDKRLYLAYIPVTIVEWRFNQKKKIDAANKIAQRLAIDLTRKEIDDLVSGNVYKTKETLALLGVDLAADMLKWEGWKDLIQTMVTRRNNIVHHNDGASDLSLGDIRQYIQCTIGYIDFIVDACRSTGIAPTE